jgi:hypothetical protein
MSNNYYVKLFFNSILNIYIFQLQFPLQFPCDAKPSTVYICLHLSSLFITPYESSLCLVNLIQTLFFSLSISQCLIFKVVKEYPKKSSVKEFKIK